MVIFDTNMILRYLLNDNKEMADKAESFITKGNVIVSVEVIAEVVYVLSGVYKIKREKISFILKEFIDIVYCKEKDVLLTALEIFAKSNLDFVDCVLFGYYKVRNFKFATFDKKLLKLIEKN